MTSVRVMSPPLIRGHEKWLPRDYFINQALIRFVKQDLVLTKYYFLAFSSCQNKLVQKN